MCRIAYPGYPCSVHQQAMRVLFVLIAVASQSVVAQDDQRIVCAMGEGVSPRIIDVIYETDGPLPCRTEYTKSGSTRVLGRAQKSLGYCEQQAKKLMAKLVQSGFRCTSDRPGAITPAAATSPVAPNVVPPTPTPRPAPKLVTPKVVAPTAAPEVSTTPMDAGTGAAASRAVDSIGKVNSVGGVNSEAKAVPRVENYLAALSAHAQAGESWAVNELGLIEGMGIDAFRQRWQTPLFATTIDANHDGSWEWFISTAECTGVDCAGYLLARSAARDAEGQFTLSLLMVADTRQLEVLNCAIPRGQWRPLLSQTMPQTVSQAESQELPKELAQTLANNSGEVAVYRVFEKTAERYQELHRCVEQGEGDGAVSRWLMTDGKLTAQSADDALAPGEPGTCKSYVQALYPTCYIPPRQ